jgi:serine/threonine protein kinase
MSDTITEIEKQAKTDFERIAAEAHSDIERIAAEARQALPTMTSPGGVAISNTLQGSASDDAIPNPPPLPDPLTIAQFKQAWRITGSEPAVDASTNTQPTQAQSWPSKIDLTKAHIGLPAGTGGFGTVSWLDTGVADAPPLVIKQGRTPKDQDELKKEAEAYKKVGEHPNVIRCLGMQTIDGKQGLVMEGIKGEKMTEVMDRLEKLRRGDKAAMQQAGMKRALSQEEYVGTLQYMTRQILLGLVHLQQQTVSHNDIRPDNIMCDSTTGEVKIVDLGLSFDMGLRPANVPLPFGWGSAAPELATRGAFVSGKADVFSAGEVVRKGMEGDQFRYSAEDQLPDAEDRLPDAKDAKAFAQPGADGKSQQALNQKMQRVATTSDNGTRDERMAQICGRLSALIADPFIAGTEIGKRLSGALAKVPGSVASAKPEDAEEILADLDKVVSAEEARLKRTGTFGAQTDYTQFVNQLMHPDPSQRLSAVDALRHPFLANRLLDDAAAQAVLKTVLADSPQQAEPGNSSPSAMSGSWIVPGNSGGSNNGSVDMPDESWFSKSV